MSGLLNALTNMTKAAVAVTVAPVALAADLLTLPASSWDPHRGPFDRTGAMLKAAGDCATQAVTPTKADQ